MALADGLADAVDPNDQRLPRHASRAARAELSYSGPILGRDCRVPADVGRVTRAIGGRGFATVV